MTIKLDAPVELIIVFINVFWRLQLILSRTNKGSPFNQPSSSISICYAFKNCQQKKLKRFVSPGSRFILSQNCKIVVVLSVLLIFSFSAFRKEKNLIIFVFAIWVALCGCKRKRIRLYSNIATSPLITNLEMKS